MRANLPEIYRDDPWITVLTNAMTALIQEQEDGASSTLEQLSLDRVTWNLEIEEQVAGIVPPPSASVEERRTALKARWRSGGKVGIRQLQAVADSWRNGAVAVTFQAGRIRVQMVSIYGIPADMDALKAAMRLVVPAHLPIDYIILYRTNAELKTYTHAQLGAWTHTTLKEGALHG